MVHIISFRERIMPRGFFVAGEGIGKRSGSYTLYTPIASCNVVFYEFRV